MLAEQIAGQLKKHFPSVSIQQVTSGNSYLAGRYIGKPVEYCYDILGVVLTPDQEMICRRAATPPFKQLVRAGHTVGKTKIAGCLTCWWYDTYVPGVVLTTAPTDRQVKDLLWKEVRVLRANAKHPMARGGFIGPKEPRLESDPNHYAHGFTARDGSRFQGTHEEAVMILFDEGVGVAPVFWESVDPMLSGASYYCFLAFYNPTDQSSRAFEEEKEEGYHPVMVMSCLDHPNIKAELRGDPPPIPKAIHLHSLKKMLKKWSDRISPHQVIPSRDVELDGQWYRPGPVAECRLLGRWPTQALNSVWSNNIIDFMLSLTLPLSGPLQIGVDCARFGDDDTSFHVRKGGNSLWHESHNGWTEDQIGDRIRELLVEWTKWCWVKCRERLEIKKVPVVVDDSGGYGGGVIDYGRREHYNFMGVNVQTAAPDPIMYPNMRSWLWFGAKEAAQEGNISLKLLAENCPEVINELRRQLLAPKYQIDNRGRRTVEPKDDTKIALDGKSPDDADGFNLSYLVVSGQPEKATGRVTVG